MVDTAGEQLEAIVKLLDYWMKIIDYSQDSLPQNLFFYLNAAYAYSDQNVRPQNGEILLSLR